MIPHQSASCMPVRVIAAVLTKTPRFCQQPEPKKCSLQLHRNSPERLLSVLSCLVSTFRRSKSSRPIFVPIRFSGHSDHPNVAVISFDNIRYAGFHRWILLKYWSSAWQLSKVLCHWEETEFWSRASCPTTFRFSHHLREFAEQFEISFPILTDSIFGFSPLCHHPEKLYCISLAWKWFIRCTQFLISSWMKRNSRIFELKKW